MRRTVVAFLVLSLLAVWSQPPVLAAPVRTAAITGAVVDPGGRPAANQRVELVQGGTILETVTTGMQGEWKFADLAPGDYVVRAVVNGQVTGARVSVAAGETERTLIVLPAAATASAAALAAQADRRRLLPFILIGVAAAVVTTIVIVTAS